MRERFVIGLVISAFWGGVFALAGVSLTWTPVLCVTVPLALWVTWPATVQEWHRMGGPK